MTRPVNFLTYSKALISWFCGFIKVTALVLLLSSPANSQSTQAAIESARHSFAYITSTLNAFNSTGRLVNNPGIDGADLEAFIDVLNVYREQFSSSFNLDSAMCQFYLDSANARMSLEEKAEIAFSFLADLTNRLDRFDGIDADFQKTLESEFGSLILEQIKRQKLTVVSNQQLPTSDFGEAAVITFIDSACS
ncbi:MAG: hypothetical protein ACI8V0_003063 [Pseudohongiellaceae bacterium]